MTDPVARLNAALEGRYAIERELGEGGMATVYLADDLKHKRKVALKVLKPELAAVVGAERFLAEITTTANLTHPHILPLHDSGEADSFLFYVMPHIEGESLRERIDREKQLPVDEAVKIATDLAEALDYAHRHKIIHRDIKPANILIHEGRPLIADFGIALAVGVAGGGRLTETGLSVGTPHYMSPEQATGDQAVGVATDIYALGAVLYEMLVGEPPYTGSTAQAILGKIIQGKLASATEERASVPANVDAAIRKSLEKLPADRFTGAQEFAKALADPAFRHGEVAVAGVAAAGRGQWTPLAMATTGSALVFGMVVGWSILRMASDTTAASPQRVSIVLPSDHPIFPGNATSALAISPNGEDLVYVRQGGQGRGLPVLMARSLGSTSVRELPGTERTSGEPFFSPDGQWVGFFTLDGELKKVSLAGGNPVTLADGINGSIWAHGPWTDEATIVFNYNGMYRVSADGGTPEVLLLRDTTRGEASIRYVEPVPGSGAVLFVAGFGPERPPRIEALILETGERRVVVENAATPHYLASGHLLFRRGDEQSLLIAPFDARSLTIMGPTFLLIDDVRRDRPDGSGLVPQLDVSQSGTLAYVPAGGSIEPTLGLLSRDGQFEAFGPELSGVLLPVPRVSPDGRYVAFTVIPGPGESEVRIHDLERGTTNTLTQEGSESAFAWHPNGREFSVTSFRDGVGVVLFRDMSGAEQLLMQQGDGLSPRRGVGMRNMSWSPDGELLAYTVQEGDLHDVWGLPVGDDASPRPLLDGPASEHSPVFSPDGRWLAYVSNESGQYQIYVRGYPEGETLTVSTAGGQGPVWSRSGDELFFQGRPDAESEGSFMSVSIAMEGETLRLGVPTQLLESRGSGPGGDYRYVGSSNVGAEYDVLPDGRFVVARASVQELREIVLVQNWFEELRERMGN